MNDVLAISAGQEVRLARDVQDYIAGTIQFWSGSTPMAPKLFLVPVVEYYGLNEFALRFPGVVFIVCVLFFWWMFGKKLLGEGILNGAILVVSTTILLPNIIKYATSDVWLLGWQLLTWLSMLFLLKKPTLGWKFIYFLSLLFGLITAPLSMSFWVIALLSFYYFKHSHGKTLRNIALSSILISSLLLILTYASGVQAALLVSFGSLGLGWWIGAQLTGLVPWFGFMLAGLKESYDKYQRSEELSVLMVGGLLAGVLSGGLVLQWVLALLAGKQLISYFHDKYPYGKWVKGGAVFVIILSCILVTASMIWAYAQFSFVGYRAFMITGGLFWVISLVAVVGLYINKYHLITLGFMMSGLMLNFGLWYRIAPVAEQSRGWVKEVTKEISDCSVNSNNKSLIVIGKPISEAELKLYAEEPFSRVEFLSDSASINFDFDKYTYLIIDADLPGQDTVFNDYQQLARKSSVFRTVPEVFYKPCN